MQGALEVKAISRLATQRGAEWKPLHTAVMGCLLAHRNRGTGHCWPDRRTIAKYCNVSERTVDRTLSQLVAWGAIEKQQPKAMAGGHFRPRQFTFLFSLPVGQSCVSRPRDKAVSHGRETKSGSTVRQNGMRNKEEEKDLKQEKDQRPKAPPEMQTSFDFENIPAAALELRTPTTEEVADRMAQYLGIPLSPRNRESLRLAVQAEMSWCGLSPPAAARVICKAAIADGQRGIAIDKFYFEDAKWRKPNANQRIQSRLERELEISRRMRRPAG